MNKVNTLIVAILSVTTIFISFILFSIMQTHNEESNNVLNRTFSIIQYKMPDITSVPLFPTYDDVRNVIWVGDSKINSGRIWEFKIDSKEFVEHKLDVGTVTSSALDYNGGLWYIDPVSKLLGHYNPDNGTNDITQIPVNSTLTNVIIDPQGNVWISATSASLFLKYNTHDKTFSRFMTLTPHASPVGMALDKSGRMWVAEAIGKIASMDTSTGKMTEYGPSNGSLKIPVAVQPSHSGDTLYISEHGEDAIFAFDIKTQIFTRHIIGLDTDALPFGMAFDNKGNLWVAEHTLNKIAMFEPSTKSSLQVIIPDINPLTQWLTSDSNGMIWFAEPGGAALALVIESGK